MVAITTVEKTLPCASVPVVVKEITSAEDCRGGEPAVEEGAIVIVTPVENALPCASVPVVVNEITTEDDGGEAGSPDVGAGTSLVIELPGEPDTAVDGCCSEAVGCGPG